MKPIQAGELNRRIRVLRRETAADAEGFPSGEPEEIYRC